MEKIKALSSFIDVPEEDLLEGGQTRNIQGEFKRTKQCMNCGRYQSEKNSVCILCGTKNFSNIFLLKIIVKNGEIENTVKSI